VSALRKRRAELASEIVHLERQLRHRRDALGHVDATLRLLDPSVDTKEIPNRRYPKRIKLFRQGELGRMILGLLRDANGQPLSTAVIVTAITVRRHGQAWHVACVANLDTSTSGKVGRTGTGCSRNRVTAPHCAPREMACLAILTALGAGLFWTT
jgi:hypothetical protein